MSRKALRNAPISQPVGEFYKKPYVSRLKDHEAKWHLLSKKDTPSLRLKNHPGLEKNSRSFVFLYGTQQVLEEGVISPFRIVANTQNYNSV